MGAYFCIGSVSEDAALSYLIGQLLLYKSQIAPETGKPVRFVYLDAANANAHKYTQSVKDALEAASPGAEFLSVDLWENQDTRLDIAAAFSEASVIFMDGGDVLRLRRVFCKHGLKDHLTKAHENGAFVGGMSAGAVILADRMVFLAPDEEEEAEEEEFFMTPVPRVAIDKGIGLLPGVAMTAHADTQDRLERLERLSKLEKASFFPEVDRLIGLKKNHVHLFKDDEVKYFGYALSI